MNQQHSDYAIWLRPKQSELDYLTGLISRLANQNRTAPFPPHITLLFGFNAKLQTIKDACEELSKQQKSFAVNLNGIDYTEKYFMNLFILAEKNEFLMNLHNKLRETLKPGYDEEYTPHVSVLYGNLDVTKQEELQSQLADSIPKTIHCERIDIYNSTGNESQWYLEESFTLK